MSEAPEAQPVTPRPAAACILMREGESGQVEVFMVRRHVESDFAPDVFVFPGGSVQESDREVELAPGMCALVGEGPTTLGSGFRAAALRECFEEAGVLLATRGGKPLLIGPGEVEGFAQARERLQRRAASLGEIASERHLTLATDRLIHWAHWVTPETFPKRFDTHFFLAEMPEGQHAAHDELETTESIWISPREAMRRFEQGELPLVFAQIHQLTALADIGSLAEAHQRYAGVVPRTIMPRVVLRDGADVILLPDERE